MKMTAGRIMTKAKAKSPSPIILPLKEVLAKEDASAEEITAAVTKVGESSQKMGAAMYAAAEADQAAAGGATGATGEADDDVVDAEIVDEPTDEQAAGDAAEGESK